ncbi:MAG: response regulator [Planctomycetota bacterium]
MFTNVLVVDDSPLERLLVESLFRKRPTFRVELANDGVQALQKVAARSPDVVLTDLVMPEMDGLELIRAVRQRHPTVPVILMTAYGDESVALEALESGAASYVPKVQRAERLIPTVERIAEHAAANRSRQRLAESIVEYHCRFVLQNDRRLIRALVDQVQQAMASVGFTETVERIRVGEAFEEALLNAMFHGNLELSCEELAQVRAELDEDLLDRLIEQRCQDPRFQDRTISVIAHVTSEEARFVIRDAGAGFRSSYADLPSAENRFESGRHRGQILMHSLMDEVAYNELGNELVLLKRSSGCPADAVGE